MYSGPIIDPHHHLWDMSLQRHPWLSASDPTAQALPGLASIAHDYLVADYVRDSAGQNIVGSVHIEALWNGDPVGETRWLETLEKTQGVALRYIANASLGTPGAAAIIAAQAAFARVVGVRGILSHHPDPRKSFVSDPDLASNSAWRDDAARLAQHGLHLELMMYPYQADAVCDLATALPNLRIVINHCGSPIDRDEAGMARWRDGLRRISRLPNVAIKVSNPGIYDPHWTLDSIRAVAMHCIDCFEPDRTMFGTDYPVSRIQMSFAEIYDTFKRIAEAFSTSDQRKLFHDTAARVYRL